MKLNKIDKGKQGWKLRRLEISIIEIMERATQPNTGWDVFQKMKKHSYSYTGDEICKRMFSLSERGYLKITGIDNDCGYFYLISR